MNATSKLVKAWESKNVKSAARAGGVSLMALSLAACGGSDTPAITQAQLDAEKAAATAAAAAQAAAEAKAAAAAAAQAAAEADAATAAEAQAAAEAAQAAAAVAQAAAEAEAAAAAVAQAAAEAAQAAAEAEAAALKAPVTVALTTSVDIPALSLGNDTVTGTSTTYEATDVIVDGSSTDADTLTVTASGDISATPTVAKIETVNFNLSGVAAAGGDGASTFDVDVANVTGASSFNFDVTSAGSAVTLLAVDNLATGSIVNSTDDFTTVTINSVDNADYTLNASAATATTVVSVVDAGSTADDVTMTSTGALTVTSTVLDGDLTLSAAGDIIVTESDESATLTATSTAGSVTVTTADTATTLNLTAADEVVITGATSATDVTVSAAGTGITGSSTTASTITATAATTLNISGNGAALVANAAGSTSLTAINITGDQNVTVELDGANLTAANSVAVTDTSTGTSVVELNADGAGITIDLVDVAADVISIDDALNANDVLSVASGATIRIDADQGAGVEINAAYASRTTNVLNLQFGDDATAADSNDVTGTLEGDNFKTVNISLDDTNETAGGIDIPTIDFATATVNLSGVADVDIASATAGSINGSTATGAIAIDLVGVATVANVTTGSGNDTVTQTTADLTTGGYTIATGAGTDSIVLLADADSAVDGGDGVDTVTMTGDYSARTVSLTNVEVLELDDGSNVKGSLVNGQSLVIRDTGDTDAASTVTVDVATVDMSGITVDDTTYASFTITGTTYGAFTGLTLTGTSVVDTITGGANGDTLTGGAGADVINGAAGADVIYGDAAADTLTGGAGSDTLYGGAAADSLFGDNDGTKEVQTVTVATTATGAGTVDINVLGKVITYTVAVGDTPTVQAAALVAAIEADTELAGLVVAESALAVATITYNIDGDVAEIVVSDTAGTTSGSTFTEASGTAGVAGTDGNDTIYGGDGADLIYGSGGTDIVDLSGDVTSVQDIVFFTDANDGFTTINNFVVNKDSISFEAMAGITGTAVDVAANAAEVNPTDGQVYIFANGADGTGSGTESVIADYTDLVDVSAFIEAGFDAAVSENFIVMINDLVGDDVHVYHVTNDGVTAAIASTDLDYIGVVADIGATALNSGEIM